MSYDDFDLDSIMAEFESRPAAPAAPAEEWAPAEPAPGAWDEAPAVQEEPEADFGESYEEPYEEPYEELYEEPYGEPYGEVKPRGLFAKLRRKRARQEPDEDDFDGIDGDYPDDGPEEDEEKDAEKSEPREARPLPLGVRLLLNLVLIGLLCLGLWWSLNNLHPMGVTAMPRAAQTPVVTEAPVVTETPAPAETPAALPEAGISAPEATPDPVPTPAPTPEPVRYYIPEDAVVAPAPNPNGFGSVPVEEADKILDVIRQARESGLLREDEEMVFDPNANFYTGLYAEEIKYYIDDSILTILWKEDIDGRCCSFSEVKVRDGSQFRRKLADDSFGSYNYYLASELAASTNCVVAMNADYYAFRDFGIVAYNRELYRFNTSTYTGNYKKYNCFDTLFVTADGDFLYKELGEVNTEDSIRQFMAENNVLFSLAFGPILVRDGAAQVTGWYPAGEVDTAYSRAGIGVKDKLHYLFMTVNHGSNAANCTVNKMAEFFERKGVITAYGLDGGQTSEIVWQGVPYNHVDWASERLVSDIIYFASAVPGAGEGGGN